MTRPDLAGRFVSDRDMRKALAGRLSAWTAMDAWNRPIRAWPPDVRRAIDETSDRFATCKDRLVAGLWQRRGRWSDPANRVDLILDADGDSYLLIAPGAPSPGVKQLVAANLANSERFGDEARAPRAPRTDRKGHLTRQEG